MKYICEDANKCINNRCNHAEPHDYILAFCGNGICIFNGGNVRCITMEEYKKLNEFLAKEEFEV